MGHVLRVSGLLRMLVLVDALPTGEEYPDYIPDVFSTPDILKEVGNPLTVNLFKKRGKKELTELMHDIIVKLQGTPVGVILHIECHGGNVRDNFKLGIKEEPYILVGSREVEDRVYFSELAPYLCTIYHLSKGMLLLNMSSCWGRDVWLGCLHLRHAPFTVCIAPDTAIAASDLNDMNREFYRGLFSTSGNLGRFSKKYKRNVMLAEQVANTLVNSAYTNTCFYRAGMGELTIPIFMQFKRDYLKGASYVTTQSNQSSPPG